MMVVRTFLLVILLPSCLWLAMINGADQEQRMNRGLWDEMHNNNNNNPLMDHVSNPLMDHMKAERAKESARLQFKSGDDDKSAERRMMLFGDNEGRLATQVKAVNVLNVVRQMQEEIRQLNREIDEENRLIKRKEEQISTLDNAKNKGKSEISIKQPPWDTAIPYSPPPQFNLGQIMYEPDFTIGPFNVQGVSMPRVLKIHYSKVSF